MLKCPECDKKLDPVDEGIYFCSNCGMAINRKSGKTFHRSQPNTTFGISIDGAAVRLIEKEEFKVSDFVELLRSHVPDYRIDGFKIQVDESKYDKRTLELIVYGEFEKPKEIKVELSKKLWEKVGGNNSSYLSWKIQDKSQN